MRHRPLALALVALICASVTTLAAGPALANVTVNEVSVPSAGSFALEGHGWGHGRGMSQWGSQGAATLGKTADTITAFYYPGTSKGALANVPMRVRLMADTDNRTEVYPATGLRIRNGSTELTGFPTSGVTRYRTWVDSAGLHLQYYSSGAWRPWGVSMAGPVDFFGPEFVRLAFPDGSSRDYRGTVRAVKTTATTSSSVDVLPMESYLRGVVPKEASPSWKLEALKAQAIAARSYSEYKREHIPSGQFFDICDTTACQVFGGSRYYTSDGTVTSVEAASTNQAIAATAGVIRTYQGAAIFAEFSSSNGGWSTAGSVPYLAAQRDDWDGAVANSVHSWRATITSAQIQAAFPAVGTLLRMRVTERDGNGEWGGRVLTVVLEGRDSAGAATSVTTTGRGIYNAHTWPASSDGLRSSWWHVVPALNSALVSQSAAPVLVHSPGTSTGTLTATFKNTGTTGWSTNGLHLTVSSPVGSPDPLVGNSQKPGVYTGTATSIDPGATASFRLSLTGDNVPVGTYTRFYRVRLGSGTVLGATVSWRIQVVAPTYGAALVSGPTGAAATNPSSGPPGAVLADGRTIVVPRSGSQSVTYAFRNQGNTSWPVSATGPVRLGTSAPHDRTSPSSGASWLVPGTRPSAVSSSAASVAPGQNGTFGLQVYGNNQPVGVSAEAFHPLWEGKAWMTGSDLTAYVVRVDPATSRLALLELAPASRVSLTTAPTGTATLVIRMRNVGGSAWVVGSEGLVASSTPLATSAWSSSTRPPALYRNASRPAVSSVYPGEVGEWRVPLSGFRKAAGSYAITFRPATPEGAPYGPTTSTSVSVTQATLSGTLVRVAGPRSVPRNGTAITYFDVKNTGNIAWPIRGGLQCEALYSGGSPSHATSWLSAVRPGPVTDNVSRAGATDVRPGEVARFAFALAGNGRVPQSMSEPFGVIWNGWARIAGVRPTLSYSIV